MAGREGPETRLVKKMRDAGKKEYGARLVTVKYHGGPYGQAGVSDLLCVLDGIFIACEVKAPESYPVKGEPSVEKALAKGPTTQQLAFLETVAKAGGYGAVVATVDQFMDALWNASCYGEYRRSVTFPQFVY